MPKDCTLFLEREIEENDILYFLERHSGFAWSSLSTPNENALAFFICNQYTAGFPTSLGLAWQNVENLSVLKLGQALAKEFKLAVLFEAENSISGTQQEKWLLARQDGALPTPVQITELDDGVVPHPISKRRLT